MFFVCGPSSNMRYLSPLSWWSPTIFDAHQGTRYQYLDIYTFMVISHKTTMKPDQIWNDIYIYNYIIKLSWNHEIHGYIPCPYCFSTLTMSPFFHAVSSRTPLIPSGWAKWKWQVLCEASESLPGSSMCCFSQNLGELIYYQSYYCHHYLVVIGGMLWNLVNP